MADQPTSADSFRELAEALPQLVWTCRPDGTCDYLSRQWIEYTGSPEAEQLGFAWLTRIHPDDREVVQKTWTAAFTKVGPYDVDARVRRYDGAYRWFKMRGTPVKDASGEVIRWVGSNTDIEDIRNAERVLRDSESQLRIVVEALSEGLITSDVSGRLTHWNQAALKMHGFATLEEAQRNLSEFTGNFELSDMDGRVIPFEHWPMHRLLRGERLNDWQVRIRRKDVGWQRIYSYGGTLVRDPQGRPHLALLTIIDYTHRHAAEERVRISEQRFRALVQVTSQIVWTTDADGMIMEDSSSWRAFTGQSYDEWKGRGWLDALHPDDRERAHAAWRDAVENRAPYRVEYRIKHVSGGWRWTVASGVPLLNQDGTVRSWVGMNNDITDRMDSQISLQRAKEAAEAASRAKDQLLAVVSHELRTPLTPVLAAASHLRNSPDLPASLRDDVEMICRNVEVESRLVNDLLSLTRLARGKIVLHQETVDVHALIHDIVSQFQPEFDIKQIRMRLQLAVAEPYVWADPTRLQQVLSNLLSNAEKFTNIGGTVIIRTSLVGKQFQIQVIDDGVGIEPEVMGRLFNPFEQGEQTVTRKFGGMGLGLSIARQLVELHGGTLTAASAGKDKGASFTISLTVGSMMPAADPAVPAPKIKPITGLSILLVEDHPDTLRTMSRLLKHLGHTVEAASTVAEAVAKGKGGPFDVLLSDIGLPDGSGLDVVRELRKNNSIRRAIALSGFGQADDVQRSRDAGFEVHLVKPVDVSILKESLRRS